MSTLSTPPTLLPSDPASLTKFLHHRHLSSLRALFELKTISYAQQQEQELATRRAKRERQRAQGGRRSRRNSSPAPSNTTTEAEDLEEDQELAKRLRLEQVLAPPPSLNAASSSELAAHDGIDMTGHAYDVVYDLAPGGAVDAYYHGPHPPPPARVVKTILRAIKQPPFFDPQGLAVAQLQAVTQPIWEAEGGGTTNSAEQEEWEQGMIAAFSGACAERIGMGMVGLPVVQRTMESQQQQGREREVAQQQLAVLQSQAQQQAAQGQQQQQQQQQQMGQPPQGYEGYGAQPFWR